MIKKIIVKSIDFYRNYLTILSFGSCRYHPTCSSYAKTQFENNNFFIAIYYSTIRILKCNPLFKGGFDYPTTKCPTKKELNQDFKQIKIKYWRIPTHNNRCLVVTHNKTWEKE